MEDSDGALDFKIVFPTAIWRKHVHYDNVDLKNYIIDLAKTTQGKTVSSYGGWQSERLYGGLPNQFSYLQNSIDETIKQIQIDTNLPKLKINDLWFNINAPGSYNILHNHFGSILSGVYYVDVPENNMGDIEFHRSDDSSYYLHDNINTFFGSERFICQSATGVLIIFPSWLKHCVHANLSDKNRISLSFNAIGDL